VTAAAYVPAPRRCSDCGAVDQTVMVATDTGDTLCSACWSETTAAPDSATPDLDRLLARPRPRRRKRTRR